MASTPHYGCLLHLQEQQKSGFLDFRYEVSSNSMADLILRGWRQIHNISCPWLVQVSMQYIHFSSAKKLPGLPLDENISSLCPLRAKLCRARKIIAQTICLRMCFFFLPFVFSVLLSIISTLEEGSSITISRFSAACRDSRWYKCFAVSLVLTQLENGRFTSNPLSLLLSVGSRTEQGPQKTHINKGCTSVMDISVAS